MGKYNLKKRFVRNTTKKDENGQTFVVDTVIVNDSNKPYETAVSSPVFRNGKWLVVKRYWTKKDAIKGHKKWVSIMNKSPKQILDIGGLILKNLIIDPIMYHKGDE